LRETEVDLGSRPQFKDGENALTVLIFDGITGQPVPGATVTVRVGSHILTATSAGQTNAYAINNLPDGSWPIFVQATGYLAFAGETYDIGGAATTPAATYTTANPKYDTQLVAMYAATQVPNDYTFKVYDNYNGLAVTGGSAIVTLTDDSTTDVGTVLKSAKKIDGSYNFRPATKVYPLTNGVATVPAADLIYGAQYTIDIVGATSSTGKYLTQFFNGSSAKFTPPNLLPVQPIFMSPIEQGADVLTFSNEIRGTVTEEPLGGTTAQLIVTVAQPVEDCTKDKFYDFFAVDSTSGTGAAVTESAATLAARNASMVIAADGLTITLSIPAASFSTPPSATSFAVISYNAGFKVRIKGTVDDTNCVAVTALTVRGTASPIDNTVTTGR